MSGSAMGCAISSESVDKARRLGGGGSLGARPWPPPGACGPSFQPPRCVGAAAYEMACDPGTSGAPGMVTAACVALGGGGSVGACAAESVVPASKGPPQKTQCGTPGWLALRHEGQVRPIAGSMAVGPIEAASSRRSVGMPSRAGSVSLAAGSALFASAGAPALAVTSRRPSA
ncbi:MAG: hypothetical protein QM820_57980 [Minicystis sp.]